MSVKFIYEHTSKKSFAFLIYCDVFTLLDHEKCFRALHNTPVNVENTLDLIMLSDLIFMMSAAVGQKAL